MDGKTVHGMMNIGTRPTVNGIGTTIEVHYLNFNEDLYGKPVKVSFHHRLRDEVKFESFDALKLQIEKDRLDTIAWFENHSL